MSDKPIFKCPRCGDTEFNLLFRVMEEMMIECAVCQYSCDDEDFKMHIFKAAYGGNPPTTVVEITDGEAILRRIRTRAD